MSLDSYLEDLENLGSSLESEIEKIIKRKQGLLVGLIKNRLYQKGIDAFGNEITPTYSKYTIEEKKSKNQRTSHVTLRDTGNFYDGIFVEIVNNVIKVDSTDGKTESLISKYGEGILGFTQEEKEFIVFGLLEPEIQKIINNIGKNGINLSK